MRRGVFRFVHVVLPSFRIVATLLFILSVSLFAQSGTYEDKPIASIEIAFAGADRDVSAAEQFRSIVSGSLGSTYSAVRLRDSLRLLYETNRIVSAQIEASDASAGNAVNLRYVIRRKTQADSVTINIGDFVGDKVTEQELRLKLNLLNPGTAVTEQTLRNNADLIQQYLRQRGFYSAEVTFAQTPLESPTRVNVVFQVNPGTQARVENFNISIAGFNSTEILKDLELKPGEFFSQSKLEDDVEKIRQELVKQDYLAPNLQEPKFTLDTDRNTIAVQIVGEVGPKVNVTVQAGKKELGEKTQRRILPIKREGTLEQAAIIEGERRLRNYYQERGYFFADARAVCAVKPDFPVDDANPYQNNTLELCSTLSGADLKNRVVDVSYNVELNRQFKLTDIRIEGTNVITYEDIAPLLDTQKANALLGLIPRLGFGRGFTSNEILEDDRERIQSVMRELGYRRATATVRQGVSPTGDNLIITFAVNEGIPTRIDDVEITGNKEIPTVRLEAELPSIENKNYSRARARNGVQKLAELYSREGYYDAKVNYSLVELPTAPNATEERVKIVYTVENEGKKVFINRILVSGNEKTREGSILKAINLETDDVLRSVDIFTSEQNLYATDAFTRVEIKPEPAGQRADGNRLTDILVNVEEQKPRIITYGGGYSTDEGALGFFDFRHVNLFGRLWQGGARVRMSGRQQLVQFDYLNPRFIKEGKNRYAPLSVTLAYRRDSTVTRFFRSTFDRGTFGIVQRLDEDGNPIDILGMETGDPTINRLTLTAETSRTISKKSRSIAFFRYRFEDVRLFNIDSLLIADLLRPDERVRVSGFGFSFVRDTRRNCNNRQSLLELIRRGDLGDPCRYNASDPTKGQFLTVDYNSSIPALGANIGFNKLQLNYQSYYTFGGLRKTTLAGRVILGLASVYSKSNRFTGTPFEEFNDALPISERFFAGGSTTLRGFEFESAGPRVAVVPQGIFRNSDNEPVSLDPFIVPFGGNALAITNLEARLPLGDSVQAVTFYDGGNVFRRVGDIFKKAPEVDPNDVFRSNLRAIWTHTVGLGFRIKTPVGGSFAVDYGFLLNPPQFLIPQASGPNAIYRVKNGQLHFRFAQIF